jgi:hypothetical protein
MEWESFFVRTVSILELAREHIAQQLAEQATTSTKGGSHLSCLLERLSNWSKGDLGKCRQ